MSSSSDSPSNPNQIIEHIVLFQLKPDADPSAVDAMMSSLSGLISLDSVLHISTGPVSGRRSNPLPFTHMLHSRYRSKSDLTSYTEHPAHVSAVANSKPIVDDVMAVDWVDDYFPGSPIVSPGSALRVTIAKLKEGAWDNEKGAVLGFLRGIYKDKSPSIEQLTVGENFSPARAKGFSICSIAVFKGENELKELDAQSELLEIEQNDVVDGVLVFDYVVAAPVQTASL